MDTLLRVHDSPVPTQTFFGFFGSSAMAPIDCTACSSNIGRYRVPLSSDFQTPPLAAPTKSVILPDGSCTPATHETRPLIAAEPMLRAPSPEMLAELNGASSAYTEIAQRKSDARTLRTMVGTPRCGVRTAQRAVPTATACGGLSSSRCW